MAEFPTAAYIERPNGAPATQTGRLTDLYPTQTADARALLGGYTYEIDFCDFATNTVDDEDWASCIATAEKEFDEGLLFVESFKVGTQYEGLKCRPGFGTGTMPEYEARALARLNGKATSYLEAALETSVLAGTNATAVSAGADLRESIAALVKQNIQNPVLHISTANAILLGSALDNILLAGIAIVISPVYSDATAFLTGAVHTWGGDFSVSVPQVATNYVLALAERQYAMAVEPGAGCKPYKVTLP